MKKTIKIFAFIAILAGIMILQSKVSAASNGIIIPNEKDLNCTRTDSGNTTILQFKDGTYGQKEENFSATLKKALAGNPKLEQMDGYLYYYTLLPKDKTLNYSTINLWYLYDGKRTNTTPVPVQLADENYLTVTGATNEERISKAKYIRYNISLLASYGNAGKKMFVGGRSNFELEFLDKNGKVVKTEKYSIQARPKFSLYDLKIEIDKGIIFQGSWEYSKDYVPTHYMVKGQEKSIKVSNHMWQEDLTSTAKYTVEDEKIATISKDGKITPKKAGDTNVKIEINGVSKIIKLRVSAETYFEDAITKDQIKDLIDQSKIYNQDIYYSSTKDTKLPAELLKAAKDLNKSIWANIYINNFSYNWEFKPENITDTSKDIDLSISKVDCYVDSLKDRNDIVFLDFKHSGKLPGKVNITIYPEEYDDYHEEEREAYLYQYNEKTKKYEFVSKVEKLEYGELNFTIDHCTKYFISDTKLDSSNKLDGEPKTGDRSAISIINLCYILAIVSIAGIGTYEIKK